VAWWVGKSRARRYSRRKKRGSRGGYDGAKRKKGSKVHAAVDTLGNLLNLHVRPANEQDRRLVEKLAKAVQEATGESVELAYVDKGYTGEKAAEEVDTHGMRLEVVRHQEAKRGFVFVPRRWIVERDFRPDGQDDHGEPEA
jgi:transposase